MFGSVIRHIYIYVNVYMELCIHVYMHARTCD